MCGVLYAATTAAVCNISEEEEVRECSRQLEQIFKGGQERESVATTHAFVLSQTTFIQHH